MPEKKKINPQIANLEIGIRNLRTIKIYPLSLGDQLGMTELITETAQEFFSSREKFGNANTPEENLALVEYITGLLRKNIAKVISLVTDEGEEIINEISNLQAIELSGVVFEMNYAESKKNALSLFKKIQSTFQSKGQ